MAVFQLLARETDDGQVLRVVENPDAESPEALDPGGADHPFLAGSEELVQLSHELCVDGWRVHDLTLVTRYLEETDEQTAQFVGRPLIALLNEESDWSVVQHYLWTRLQGLLVFAIELRDTSDSKLGRVRLSQNGVVQTQSTPLATQLPSLLDGREIRYA